jgi:lipase chaperone LimK
MISRIEGKDFNEYVQWFRNNADEVESSELRTKVWQVTSELGELNRRLAGHEAERQEWAQKLDDLQGALVACESAHGVGSMCQPFFAKAARIIEECEHPTGGSPKKE